MIHNLISEYISLFVRGKSHTETKLGLLEINRLYDSYFQVN